MKHQGPLLAGLLVLSSLCGVPSAQAQLPWRWFGPKAVDKSTPSKAALVDPRRAIEVNVEVAWLADPVTFPYYLEAHADARQLEVRGYVPTKAVREHALRIAQVYSSLPVADAMREHPSLLVRPTQMSPQQLQNSVQSSLRVALPKQYQLLKVECGADGKVVVAGPVNSVEEKLAVSHSLRRLHGCTSVQNQTALAVELTEGPREKLPIIKTSNTVKPKADKAPLAVNSADAKSKSWFSWPFGKATTTKEEPPLLDPRTIDIKGPIVVDVKDPKADSPILIPNVEEPKKEPSSKSGSGVITVEVPAVPAKAPSLSIAELQKSIKAACPKVLSVEVQLTSAKEARITLEIRADADLAPTAEEVFALRELQNYRLDLQFKISPP